MGAIDIKTGAAGGLVDLEADAYHRRHSRLVWRRRILPFVGVFGFLVLWWAIVAGLEIKPFIAPSPLLVAETLIGKWDVLLQNVRITAFEAAGGFLLGNIVAIVLATVFVHNKVLNETLFPVFVAFNSIPVVAKAPILVLIMGNGFAPKVTIAALVCFFPTLVNMVKGLESVNPQALELMRVLSATRTEVFFKLRTFQSLPFLFSSLRIAASMSVIGAIVGEWIGSTTGIGALIIQATFNFDSALLYSAIVMSACLTGCFFFVVTLLERWVIRWPVATH